MIDEKSNETPVIRLGRSTERTFVLGYAISSVVAYVVFLVAVMAWSGNVISRFQLGFAAGLFALAVVPLWIAMLVPFVVVRKLADARGFASPWRSVVWGAAIGLVSIPFGVEMSRIFDFEGIHPSFPVDLAQVFTLRWPFFAAAGGVGGLTYWVIEFSSIPSAILTLFTDSRPVQRTGNLLSRRLIAMIVMASAVGISVPAAQWWWRPHVRQSSTVPEVEFAREWPTRDWVGFIAWSPKPSTLTSLSGGVVRVQSQEGVVEWEKRFPNIRASGAVASDREIVVPDALNSRAAFSVISLETGKVTHQEPDPAPGAGGMAGFAVKLAMSLDGSSLAVAYSSPRAGQPVSVYVTQDWRRLSTIKAASDGQLGSRYITFSADGTRVAFGDGRDFIVADSRTGTVLQQIPASVDSLAFSPSGDMVAAWTTRFSPDHGMLQAVRVYRVADGSEIASHSAQSSIIGSPLVWDLHGRFIAFIDGGDTIRLWNPYASSGNDLTISVRPNPGYVAMSPSGRCLAVGNENFISLFRITAEAADAQHEAACG